MTATDKSASLGTYQIDFRAYVGIALVSAVYFVDIFLKASHKCFWFDELFTTYLCRLRDFQTTWSAVLHGADFNPPLLYLFTRGAQRLFGEGLIATRLPEMIGVWLFGICLFLFVAKRAGAISGFIAGTFPFFTLVQYYGYEARAHGVVLGWCGLTLLCWQRRAEGNAKNLWLAGFGLCLVGALLTHLYAVYIIFPFFLVEVYRLFVKERPDWGIITAMALALTSVTVTVYLPLFRAYRASVPASFFPASHDLLLRFLLVVFGPALGVLLIAIVLVALEGTWFPQPVSAFAAIPKREMLVAAGFACLPFVGLLGSKISHGPFIERYFLSGVAGYAIFLGFAFSRRQVESRTAQVLAACMFLLMIEDVGATIYLSMNHRLMLTEPSAGIALSTTPTNPMQRYETIASDHEGLDILVLQQTNYLFFYRYAPHEVVSRLYFGAARNDLFLGILERLAKGAEIGLREAEFNSFLSTHRKLLVYGSTDSRDTAAIQELARAGYALESVRVDAGGVMYEYTK